MAGEAVFSGGIAVVDVPRAALCSLVARGASLPGTESHCACLLAFGRQDDASALFGGVAMPWRVRYHEFMVAIPFVRWLNGERPYLYIAGMVCDAWWAVWNGNLHYGFAKRLAPMTWSGARFLITDGAGQCSFDARLHRHTGAEENRLRWIQEVAALPVLGVRDDGMPVQSQFEWNFRDATVEPRNLALAIGPHLRELPRVADTCPIDAYEVRGMRWRLSWPMPLTR